MDQVVERFNKEKQITFLQIKRQNSIADKICPPFHNKPILIIFIHNQSSMWRRLSFRNKLILIAIHSQSSMCRPLPFHNQPIITTLIHSQFSSWGEVVSTFQTIHNHHIFPLFNLHQVDFSILRQNSIISISQGNRKSSNERWKRKYLLEISGKDIKSANWKIPTFWVLQSIRET